MKQTKTTPQISIVLPCYNEGKMVGKMVETTAKILSKKYGEAFEIIAVNDGSKDQTLKFLELAAIRVPQARIISYDRNQGKGYALKMGLKAAKGVLIGFIDSDMEIPPELIPQYAERLENEGVDCIAASKLHNQSIIQQSFGRKILSWGSRKMVEYLFQLKNVDTQVGLKLFRREAIQSILGELKTNSFAFDIEILVLLRREHYRIASAPVYINQSNRRSKVGTFTVAKTFLDTMKIYHARKRDMRNHSISYGFVRYAMLGLLLLPMEFIFQSFFRG
ncbi:MAG TPA: glycosyltransferase [Candidatus Gracilibacteria bacterium]